MSDFTCINCSVRFSNAEIQRQHYKTDWHRYNLKRKVAALPPVTAEEFQKRVLQQRNAEETALQNTQQVLYCSICRKNFSSENAYGNHVNSKKHQESVLAERDCCLLEESSEEVRVTKKVPKEKPIIISEVDDVDDSEEIDSDEWEDVAENPIDNNDCIFCDHHSEDFVENMKHMCVVHSFFLPDPDYCQDVRGLMEYLGTKIVKDFICIWCNEKGKSFYTLDAVRKHMRDKGHCKMLHEGITLAEYADFYDYSSSYPDHAEGMDIDEEMEPAATTLDGDEYQLVLPSGAIIGHRSLMRYYKQRLNPNRALVPQKSDKKLHKVLAEYRSLGWTAAQQESVARKARDIHYMKRQHAKMTMRLGVKANKMQTYFRCQNPM